MFKIIFFILALHQALMIANSIPYNQRQKLSEKTFRTDSESPINPNWNQFSRHQNPRHYPDPKEEGSYDPPLAKSRFAVYESNGQYSFLNTQ